MDKWEVPYPISKIPKWYRWVVFPTSTRRHFVNYLHSVDSKIWEMTQAQRETWKNEIMGNWDKYRHILRFDGTKRHYAQLSDMNRMGGGVILIAEQYGTGKSITANSHLKIWQMLKYRNTGDIITPHVYFRKSEARSNIRKTENNTAHSIDEDMKATGSGSHNIEVHIQNIFETIRKTGKLVVIVGVNLTSSVLKKAIALQIEPFGFNRALQANRFIVKDYNNTPLWMAVTQRCYLPHEQVFYEGELGTFSEYSERAIEFSSTSTGVYSGALAEDEKEWVDKLTKHWILNFGYEKPSIDELEYWAIQIEIPPESAASIRRVCSVTKRIIKRKGIEANFVDTTKEELEINEVGWIGLRQIIQDSLLSKQVSERDAEATAFYLVPSRKQCRYKDIKDEFGLGITTDSIGWFIRKRRNEITSTEKGIIGEKFVESHIESLTPQRGSGSKDSPDILLKIDDTEIALNVKLSFEDGVRRDLPSTPEHNWEHAYLILLLPRLHEVRIFTIEGESTYVNSRKGILATPETLVNVIQGLVTKVGEKGSMCKVQTTN